MPYAEKYDDNNPQILIPVDIQNPERPQLRNHRRALFDPGAAYSLIDRRFAMQILGLHPLKGKVDVYQPRIKKPGVAKSKTYQFEVNVVVASEPRKPSPGFIRRKIKARGMGSMVRLKRGQNIEDVPIPDIVMILGMDYLNGLEWHHWVRNYGRRFDIRDTKYFFRFTK